MSDFLNPADGEVALHGHPGRLGQRLLPRATASGLRARTVRSSCRTVGLRHEDFGQHSWRGAGRARPGAPVHEDPRRRVRRPAEPHARRRVPTRLRSLQPELTEHPQFATSACSEHGQPFGRCAHRATLPRVSRRADRGKSVRRFWVVSADEGLPFGYSRPPQQPGRACGGQACLLERSRRPAAAASVDECRLRMAC
jgi:hypothetical protein